MAKYIPNSTSLELIAPCGINCRLCRAYVRAKNPCPGCRIDNLPKPKSRVICRIKTCPRIASTEVEWCYDCPEFPCFYLARLDKRYRMKYGTDVIGNLRIIQEIGLQSFVQAENQKWTCPQCGKMLCMHEPECLSCEYVWREE